MGCADYTPHGHAVTERHLDHVTVRCAEGHLRGHGPEIWDLTCRGDQWTGTEYNCSHRGAGLWELKHLFSENGFMSKSKSTYEHF